MAEYQISITSISQSGSYGHLRGNETARLESVICGQMTPEDKQSVSARLREAFSFPRPSFSGPISWADAVGVSRVKDFPDGHASLYKIGIIEEELGKASDRKKLFVSVSYGKKVSEGISLGSEKGSLFDPIDFDSRDEFSVDLTDFTFFQNDKKIAPEQILTILEERHMKPTKMGAGLLLRIYLWYWRVFLPKLVKVVDYILLALLWVVSGETIERDILGRLLDGIRTEKPTERIVENVEFTDVKTMEFFGYKAKRWSVVFYCAAHLIFFSVLFYYSVRSPLIETVFGNNFTALCYIVVSFAITEAGIPGVLKFLLGKTPQLYGHVSFLRLKLWGSLFSLGISAKIQRY